MSRNILIVALFFLTSLSRNPAFAQETIDVGKTGFDVKKPVLASACPNGCPWGELGDYVKEAMAPLGYEVILCRNCNRDRGPRFVSTASPPPDIDGVDTAVGTTQRVNAPVDFGVTESGMLESAYEGRRGYATDGPYKNLRLIAKIEDPYYLLVAVKKESGITDLAQIADAHMPVKIVGGETPYSQPVLDYYGLTKEAVVSWGGSFENGITAGLKGANVEFDVIVNELAGPSNNPESSFWPILGQAFDLYFLDLPEDLLDKMAADKELGMERVIARWGLLRGVDRPIPTVARSGNAVFSRDDMPEQAAYDTARAIDEHRSALKWFIRPYSYNSDTAWKNFDVPLHPGAKRYYQEKGYMPGAKSDTDASETANTTVCKKSDDGCSVTRDSRVNSLGLFLIVGAGILLSLRKRR
jgi:uncharacterized protein